MTIVAGVFLVGSFLASAGGPADVVDTRIGTETGRGSCMVGPCVPHGSVYPSPDTIWPSAGRKFPAPSGYYHGDKVVVGGRGSGTNDTVKRYSRGDLVMFDSSVATGAGGCCV